MCSQALSHTIKYVTAVSPSKKIDTEKTDANPSKLVLSSIPEMRMRRHMNKLFSYASRE